MIEIRVGKLVSGPYTTMRTTDRENVFRFYTKTDRVEYFVPPEEQTLMFWWHCEDRMMIPPRYRPDVDLLDQHVRKNRATPPSPPLVVHAVSTTSVNDLLDLLR